MRAVNLVPPESRRGRLGGGGLQTGDLAPSHFLIVLMVIVVALILLRVLEGNKVSDRQATLAKVQAQVAQVQAQAAKLNVYVSVVQAAEQREQQVRALADSRFPWKAKFDDLAHVLPATTYLTALSGTVGGSSSTAAPATTSAAGAVPTFTLAGCADTPNQNGTATLLRRLAALPGVTDVGFENSTRQAQCGNNFNLTLTFKPVGATAAAAPGTATAPVTTTATATTTATTTVPATTSTVSTATTSTGSAG